MSLSTVLEHDISQIDQELEAVRKEMIELENEKAPTQDQDAAANRIRIAEKGQLYRGNIEAFLKVCESTRNLNAVWRRCIVRGEIAHDKQADSAIRGLLAILCVLGDHIQETVNFYSRHGTDFSAYSLRLDQCARDAKQMYRTWQSPVASSSPAIRTVKVPPGEVEEARALFAK